MDVAPGASGDVRGGGALLDIPSQAAIHLELDPSRINVRARSFAAGSAGGQDQESTRNRSAAHKKRNAFLWLCSPCQGASIAVLFVAGHQVSAEGTPCERGPRTAASWNVSGSRK